MKIIFAITQTVWKEMIRRKDLYVVLIIQLFFTFLLSTLNTFGTTAPARYILDLGLLVAFILSIILAITLTARQFPGEVRTGTIFTVLTKPITRTELLLGKWLGCWSSMLLANASFYLIIASITTFMGHHIDITTYFQVFCLHNSMIGILIAITLFFTQFVSQGAGSSLSFVLLFLSYYFVPRIPHLLVTEHSWRHSILLGLYYIAPHFELFDMRRRFVHDWGALDFSTLLITLLYGVLLTAGFLLLAWLKLRRKQFRRGAVA